MNQLFIGLGDFTERLLEKTKPGFLLIDDGEIADAFLARFPRAKLFDPARHSFNPLRGIDYKRARDFAAALYTINPQGENTLTVRNGKRAMAKLLLHTTRLDKFEGDEETQATVDDLLLSPVLRSVLCKPTDFSFKGSVVARINRAELGDFDAFVVASFLIGQHPRQVIIPDFGFYGRDFHMSLLRQDRLAVGVQYLAELPVKLQQAALSIKDKTVYRTTKEDAERLVIYTHHTEPRNLYEQTGDEYISC